MRKSEVSTLSDISNPWILSEDTLKTKKEYKSIEEGLNNPLEVYKLNLHAPGSISKDILAFERLNELDIYMPKFHRLPRFIYRLRYLQTISILDSKIKHLPEEITQLQHLKRLRLWKLYLVELPDSIGKLHKLEELELFANNLKQLPQSVDQLISLRKIGLDNNDDLNFYDAFEKLDSLPKLTYLNINYYPHDTLPSNLWKLQELETISIWNNASGKLNYDDLVVKLSPLKKLKQIDLTGNRIDPELKKKYIKRIRKVCHRCEVKWSDI